MKFAVFLNLQVPTHHLVDLEHMPCIGYIETIEL